MRGHITVDGREFKILAQTAKVAEVGGVVVLVVAEPERLPSKDEFPVFEKMCSDQLREIAGAMDNE